jgi:hypothetical protein
MRARNVSKSDHKAGQGQRGGGGVEIRPRDGMGGPDPALGIGRIQKGADAGHGGIGLPAPAKHPLHRAGGIGGKAMGGDLGNPGLPQGGATDLGRRVGQHHGAHKVEPLGRQPLCHQPAHRTADDHRIAGGEMLQHPLGIADQGTHRVGRGGDV